ncbi:probable glutamate receptor [Euwallacea fornicatus]|uniref:probable glutamate receptor n=1 Tax=Euwallacea fornicatus TaxID=995702 RepID=UPI00338E0030
MLWEGKLLSNSLRNRFLFFLIACNMKIIRLYLNNCFNSNGLSVAFQKNFHRDSSRKAQAKTVLIVSFITKGMNLESYSDQLNLFDDDLHFKWLNIYPDLDLTNKTDKLVLERMRYSEMTMGMDLVIAVSIAKNASRDAKVRLLEGCKRFQALPMNVADKEVKRILPFNTSLKKNQTFNVTFSDLCNEPRPNIKSSFCMLQVYKIRKNSNTTMVIIPLGYWNYEVGTDQLKKFQTDETRRDFLQSPLIFGKQESSKESKAISEESLVEDVNDMENLNKIADYITAYLNATQKDIVFPNLGLKAVNGNWSGLLGAVIDQEVDIGLDSVIKTPDLYNEVIFTHDIMVSERNIYLKPEQSNSARNIFMAPFSPDLLFHVCVTVMIFAAVMALYIATRMEKFTRCLGMQSHVIAISDALFWIIGVISMQGTQIQPNSGSGNMIILFSLFFALIIYNSYSAFITSMLSVKLNRIRTISDLLKSDYDIGYIKNSPDEIFLRTVIEPELNQIYLRGYLHNDIKNITEGLLKATKGNYGLFATGHMARKEFLKISGYKCKYEIMEIPAPQAKNKVAFPMSHISPYRKVINLCLIRMKEGGVHHYINSRIAPKLPQCNQQSSYQSARINDIVTSIALFLIGFVFCIVLFLMEYLWKKRKKICGKFRTTYRSISLNFEFVN